jgi:hypothetical protein
VRRHARWLGGAVVAATSVVLAVVVPASWWGATFVAGVLVAMVGLRPLVSAAYAPGWTRSTVIVVGGAVCAGGCYAFAAEPWGPVPQIAWPLGAVLVLGLLATCADAAQTGVLNARGGAYANKMSRRGGRRR